MKFCFIIPPVATPGHRPAERSAGCTRVVYPMPNIYELTVAALVEQLGHGVEYHNFTLPERTPDDLRRFLAGNDADVYCIWGVNLD